MAWAVKVGYCSAVEQDAEKDFNARVAGRVGKQVALAREGAAGRKMTAQALADRCAQLGHPLDRSVIAKLEKGIRQTITVAELLVLAEALGVPPIELLFPLAEADVEALPGASRSTWAAAQWFMGERPLPGADGQVDTRWEPPLVYGLYRTHEYAVAECLRAAQRTYEIRTEATLAAGDDRAELNKIADVESARAQEMQVEIRAVRATLRSAGFEPPTLPSHLRKLDSEDGQGK
ncbi:helix-turn-helix transcriptional regulator [Streptomyces scabiei]|uniref:helix-turn-helix domain-containing protein n=1 Tax=Streptomyces scabiei TaxID=1930 RepID=UPI0033C66029